jgi:NAD+ synthase
MWSLFMKNNFNNMIEYKEYLIKWMKEILANSKTNGYVIGISGGIDSAVCYALAMKASDNIKPVFININNSELDIKCVRELESKFKNKIQQIDLDEQVNSLYKSLDIKNDKSVLANMKARIRMTTLYSFAQINNYLVIGTDNACEYYTGYFTKWGDGAADLLPLVKLNKSEVYELAKILEIPDIIIQRAPSASLWDSQTDEQEMGVTYNNIDSYLFSKKIDEESEKTIYNMYQKTQHKRNPIIKPDSYNNKIPEINNA